MRIVKMFNLDFSKMWGGNKAMVFITDKNEQILQSYNTVIAVFKKNKCYYDDYYYSKITKAHLNRFLNENHIKKEQLRSINDNKINLNVFNKYERFIKDNICLSN